MKMGKLSDIETMLLDASRDGNLSSVRESLAKGAQVDAKDNRDFPFDVTPLMYAAKNGHHEVVKALLDAGASIKAKDKHAPGEGGGQTALHYAAEGKHPEAAKLLLKAGADANALANASTGTPLHCALQREPRRLSPEEILDPEKFRYGDSGASADELKRIAVMAECLLQAGADPNIPAKQGQHRTLHHAAGLGSVDILRLLISHGADINAQDSQGCTAFSMAITNRHIQVAKWLITNGLNVQLHEKDCTTHLMWAVLSGNPDLVQMVVSKGVDLHEKNKFGDTALSLAIRDGYRDVEQMLRKAGAK